MFPRCISCLILSMLIITLLITINALGDDEFRHINKIDLLASNAAAKYRISDNGVFTRELIFDVEREQIIVGARDAILRLSLRNLREFEKASWPASDDKMELCQNKGQSEWSCHNYIRVLLSDGERLFACGTGAFSPVCSWRALESLQAVLEWMPGEAKCPYDPFANVTSLLTAGQYYSGTTTNFAGTDTAIYRTQLNSRNDSKTLRTTQYDANLLNEPQFVGSFQDDSFVYFVFREDSVEYSQAGKTMYSRIARVCKNDFGGNVYFKDSFSTYIKARLNCSIPGTYPFSYDSVEGIHYDDKSKLLFATFNTLSPAIPGAAVCVYSMDGISRAFESIYITGGVAVPPSNATLSHFNCHQNRSDNLVKYRQFKLAFDAVQPVSGTTVFRRDLQHFTDITVDKLDRDFVAYIVTQSQDILKISIPGRIVGQGCLIERWKIGSDVMKISFLKETESLYIVTPKELLNVPVKHCERYASINGCIASADPYCAWSDHRDMCVASGAPKHYGACSSKLPVDGGWSEWSEWAPCLQEPEEPQDVTEQDTCQCRTRVCNNPTPAYGGRKCEGMSISVSSCRVHGAWGPWGAWEACSATCGSGVKQRRRACNAPTPRHGGRLCVGPDTQEMRCNDLPACEERIKPGTWSAWTSWSTCVGKCGSSGESRRTRECLAPPCDVGDDSETRACTPSCSERQVTAWSPWLRTIDGQSNGSFIEKRFQFTCRARTSQRIKLNQSFYQTRSIGGDSQIHTSRERANKCSAGSLDSLQCWSDWGPCEEVNIQGYGTSIRTRGSDEEQTRPCYSGTGGVWSPWDEWSECIDAGVSGAIQVRRRHCATGACVGAVMQARSCGTRGGVYDEPYTLSEGIVEPSVSCAGVTSIATIACVIACVAAFLLFVWWRSRRIRGVKVPASPHYITTPAPYNTYVTLPLSDPPRKAKRQPSFSGSSSGANVAKTLNKNNVHSNPLSNNYDQQNTMPKLYPKSIVKDMQLNGTLRSKNFNKSNINIDEDNFY